MSLRCLVKLGVLISLASENAVSGASNPADSIAGAAGKAAKGTSGTVDIKSLASYSNLEAGSVQGSMRGGQLIAAGKKVEAATQFRLSTRTIVAESQSQATKGKSAAAAKSIVAISVAEASKIAKKVPSSAHVASVVDDSKAQAKHTAAEIAKLVQRVNEATKKQIRGSTIGIIGSITKHQHKVTQQQIIGQMYDDETKGTGEADVHAMSSAVAHQKKATNYWTLIIIGGVLALVLFFVLLGLLIAKLIPKEKKLTEEEKADKEKQDVKDRATLTIIDKDDPPNQKSRCCAKCTIPNFSEIKMVNYVFLVSTTIMCCAGSMTIGQALYNDGPIAEIVSVQQEWPPFIAKQMTTYFLAAPTLGISIGSTFGSAMMVTGRRLPVIIFNLIGILGCFLSIQDSYFVMMLGKLFFGMGAGVLIAVAPRILEETIPGDLIDHGFGAMTNVGVDAMSLTSTIMIMFMPKKASGSKAEAATQLMKDSKLYKLLYLLPVPMFATSFLLNIMCFRRETLGYYVHKKDKPNSIRAIRQIYMGEKDIDYNMRYDELCADDDLNYKEPGDYLQAAKDATAKLAKVVAKVEKAESEISAAVSKVESEVSKVSKEVDQISKDISKASKAIDNASKYGSELAEKISDAPAELMAAGMKKGQGLLTQAQDGDVMGLYKEAKGFKADVQSDIEKVQGLGSAIAKEKKQLQDDVSSAKAKYKNAKDQAKAAYGQAKDFKDDVKKGGFKKAAGDRAKKAAKDKWAALSQSASSQKSGSKKSGSGSGSKSGSGDDKEEEKSGSGSGDDDDEEEKSKSGSGSGSGSKKSGSASPASKKSASSVPVTPWGQIKMEEQKGKKAKRSQSEEIKYQGALDVAPAKASGSGSGSGSKKSGSGSGSGSGSKKSGSGSGSGSAKSGSGSGSGSKGGSSQPPSGGLSAPTSTKNKAKAKKAGEKTGFFEKLGNLQVPGLSESQSDSKPSPKASWDHTPANSTEAREIDKKKQEQIIVHMAKQQMKEAKKEAKASLNAAIQAQIKKLVPAWLIGSDDDPGAVNCLFLKEYRSGTWICLTLATFNTLSGITTLLIYLDYIFETANKGKQPITLNSTQMGGALAVSLALGAAAGTSLVKDWKRRTVFCVSHLVIGCLLLAAGYFVHRHHGIGAFICIWFAQFWLQILTAPLFIYQTEVLQNNALGMVNAWRALCFTALKIFVDNLFNGLEPVFYIFIGEVFVFFGILQVLAAVVIYHIFTETKGKTQGEKRITTNPIAMKNFKEIISKVDENIDPMYNFDEVSPPFERVVQNALTIQVRDFVNKSFESFGLSPEADKLTKTQAQIMTVRLMHKHGNLDQFDQYEFDRLYNLYEDCDADDGHGHVLGLDRKELQKLFVRVAKL